MQSNKVTKQCSNIGIYGIGTRNERGNRLEEFFQANDLVIGNTTFKQPPRRLYTWVSPGDRARIQIDYVMVKRRWKSLLLGVKTRPSADCGSDHQLLNAKIKIRMKTRKTNNSLIRYDVSNLPQEFKVEIKNKFLPLLAIREEETTPNALWECGLEAIQGVAQETVPRKKKTKNPWISEYTIKLAQERREAKSKGNREHWKMLDKEVTKSAKNDKN